MIEPTRTVIVFESVHDTLKAETCLAQTYLKFTVRPIPPSINKGCGLGIEISSADLDVIRGFLEEYQIEPLKYVALSNVTKST